MKPATARAAVRIVAAGEPRGASEPILPIVSPAAENRPRPLTGEVAPTRCVRLWADGQLSSGESPTAQTPRSGLD